MQKSDGAEILGGAEIQGDVSAGWGGTVVPRACAASEVSFPPNQLRNTVCLPRIPTRPSPLRGQAGFASQRRSSLGARLQSQLVFAFFLLEVIILYFLFPNGA